MNLSLCKYRSPPSSRKTLNGNTGSPSSITANINSLSPQTVHNARNRSRSPTPASTKTANVSTTVEQLQVK